MLKLITTIAIALSLTTGCYVEQSTVVEVSETSSCESIEDDVLYEQCLEHQIAEIMEEQEAPEDPSENSL